MTPQAVGQEQKLKTGKKKTLFMLIHMLLLHTRA